MDVEIITAGTELLRGEVIDTNSALIARELSPLGFDICFKTAVGDRREHLKQAVSLAMGRADVVIITGGLGPTADDLTREAVAEATGRELVFREDLFELIKERFDEYDSPLSRDEARQAYLPQGATPVENPRGSAPGFILEEGLKTIIALPGVPGEMEFLLKSRLIPYLKGRYPSLKAMKTRTLKFCGIGESIIGEALEGILSSEAGLEVGIAVKSGEVHLTLSAKGEGETQCDQVLSRTEARVRSALDEYIYGADDDVLEEVVARSLIQKGLSLAIAEACKGSSVAPRLLNSSVPQAPNISGFAAADPRRLGKLLDLDNSRSGELSRHDYAYAIGLAKAARLKAKADIGLSVIGIFSEGGGQSFTCQVAIDSESFQFATDYKLGGGQVEFFRDYPSMAALDNLRRYLTGKL